MKEQLSRSASRAVLYTEENRKALEGGNLHEKENEQKKEPQRE